VADAGWKDGWSQCSLGANMAGFGTMEMITNCKDWWHLGLEVGASC